MNMAEWMRGTPPVTFEELVTQTPEILGLFFKMQGIYDQFDTGAITADQASKALTDSGLTEEYEEPDPTLGGKSVLSMFMDYRRSGGRIVPMNEEINPSKKAA